MQPEAYQAFVDEFTREYNAKANQSEALKVRLKADLQRTKSEIQKLIEEIKAGVPGDALKDEMQSLQDRQKKIEEDIGAVPPPAPRLHPNLASIYKEKIANLVQALNDPNTLIEASTAIRQLIERVQLVPENGELKIELYGELAALLKLGTKQKNKHPQAKSEGVQITVVAGAPNLYLGLFRCVCSPRVICGMSEILYAVALRKYLPFVQAAASTRGQISIACSLTSVRLLQNRTTRLFCRLFVCEGFNLHEAGMGNWALGEA